MVLLANIVEVSVVGADLQNLAKVVLVMSSPTHLTLCMSLAHCCVGQRIAWADK